MSRREADIKHDASAGGDCGWAPVIVAGVALALLLYVYWRVCR